MTKSTPVRAVKLSIHAQIESDLIAYNKKVQSESNCYILVRRFLKQNSHWPLDSIVSYLLTEYKDYKISPGIISECINDYITDKH